MGTWGAQRVSQVGRWQWGAEGCSQQREQSRRVRHMRPGCGLGRPGAPAEDVEPPKVHSLRVDSAAVHGFYAPGACG